MAEARMSETKYEGPEQIAYAVWPGRGATYSFPIAGRRVEVYVTEKKKLIRIYVDGTEWKAAAS